MKKSKHKELEELLKYQISSRILQNNSIIKSFQNKEKYVNNVTTMKDTFYNLLDVLVDNETNIIKNLNEKIAEKTDRNIKLIFYDTTTIYFEIFVREWLRIPRYSKDGKFKEDQVVVGMATDSNGIPMFLKVFKGNIGDPTTFIPFIVDLKKTYNIQKVTIIADRGVSTNKNIRFLESHNLDYIISYRLKLSNKGFKDFSLNPEGYIKGSDNFKYKEYFYYSKRKNKRTNNKQRRIIITYSEKRAKKDLNDRTILMKNFLKKQNKNGVVKADDVILIKKYKFYKKVGNMKFVLDAEKVNEDKKYDGYYVYETSRQDLSPKEIVDFYQKQWQIEENIRTFKSALRVRPVHVRTDKHIKGHFILNFISLIVLKYTLYKLNKFYFDNGVIQKYTNDSLISLLNTCNQINKIRDGQVIERSFVEPTINSNSEQEFDEINNI
ncbi:IS1634 family transposase [Mycoplasma sp. CSL7491-lung]|uniref:IS1634 family transposase n=1 Tax=Mycoplasma sp. CSL7491-lung TaxID=549718 RepID=UPI001C11DD73|nr:IS1634 family transposase [Mycoplasma sp. CSL7491-lung]MBU4692799.1 IS1634 family transposase [Mycoplasma sp. CSL7491-lung]